MSEWRGQLHPRDRRGQFRQALERLASSQPVGGRVEFQGGAIARNKRGYYSSEAEGFPTGRHGSARAAVNRLIAVGKASPGDPVSKAAQALADLYRAQESGLGQGRALSKVTESWRGLDFTQRSRAKLIARHLVRA
jgi:hypothetical protein